MILLVVFGGQEVTILMKKIYNYTKNVNVFKLTGKKCMENTIGLEVMV